MRWPSPIPHAWLLPLTLLAGPLRLDAITVANLFDSGAGSLRQAILDAAPGDLITFHPSLDGGTIPFASEIVINKSLRIDATSQGNGVAFDGGNNVRLFHILSPAVVEISNAEFRRGRGVGAANSNLGGALRNTGLLTLRRCTLAQNSTLNAGGAIHNAGTLTLERCTVHDNVANGGGGGGGIVNNSTGTLTLTQCTVVANRASASSVAGGGGVYNTGTLKLIQVLLASNTATTGTGHDLFHNGGTVTLKGVNLFSDLGNTGLTAGPLLLVGSPWLTPLGEFGGPVPTRIPLFNSPATHGGLGVFDTMDARGFALGDASWANDFSAGLGGATVLTQGGHANTGTINGESFQFTAKVQEQLATLILPSLGSFSTFSAHFRLYYSDAAGSGLLGPADGMSFSFGPAPATPVGEDGVPGACRVSFNHYNTFNPTYGVIRYFNPAGTIVQEATFPRFDDANKWHDFTVTLDATGRLRVAYDNIPKLDVPNVAYTPAAGDRFTFGARTGGDVSEQRVDDILVVTDIAGGAPDIGATENLGVPDVQRFWTTDWDGDGSSFGLEFALGTDPLGFNVPQTMKLQPSVAGAAPQLALNYNPQALPYTQWILERSPALAPPDFQEIYRFVGPSMQTVVAPGAAVNASRAAQFILEDVSVSRPAVSFYRILVGPGP